MPGLFSSLVWGWEWHDVPGSEHAATPAECRLRDPDNVQLGSSTAELYGESHTTLLCVR